MVDGVLGATCQDVRVHVTAEHATNHLNCQQLAVDWRHEPSYDVDDDSLVVECEAGGYISRTAS